MEQLCHYYQATMVKESCWIVTSALRYSEYIAFDRCLHVEQSVFEFFVAPDLEQEFLDIMTFFEAQNMVKNVIKCPNPYATV